MKVQKLEQPILGWGLHHEEKTLRHHAIISLGLDGGSVTTTCKGRWSPRDSWSWFPGRDTVVFPKCGACVDYVNAERESEGLDAIAGAHPWYVAKDGAVLELGGEA